MTVLKNFLSKTFILLTTVLFFLHLWRNRQVYLQPFDIKLHQSRFEYSQYNKNLQKQFFFIQDWELYPLAGYNYLKNWQLDQINPEHPPLGKYLFGLSILLFKNSLILQIFLGAGTLYLLYILAKNFLKNNLLAVLAVFLFSLERLFLNQLSLSLLDLMHLFFLLILALALQRPRGVKDLTPRGWIVGVSLGVFAAIKAPIPAIAASLAILFHFWINSKSPSIPRTESSPLDSVPLYQREKLPFFVKRGWGRFFVWLKINLIAFSVFLLTYLPFILKSGFNNFFQLILKAIKIHLSHVPEYPVGSIYGVIFTNQWRIWWNPQSPFWQIGEWSFFWPILGILLLISPFFFWRYFSQLKRFAFIYFFSWLYFIFISTRLFFPGYLLILLPFLYLIMFRTIGFLKHYFSFS